MLNCSFGIDSTYQIILAIAVVQNVEFKGLHWGGGGFSIRRERARSEEWDRERKREESVRESSIHAVSNIGEF